MENSKEKFKSAAELKEEKALPKESLIEPIKLEEIIRPRTLELLTQETGYTFAPNPRPIPPDKYGWFTNEDTKKIYFNPKHLIEFKEQPRLLEALLLHEAGHHTDTAKILDKELRKDFDDPEIIPETLKGNKILENKFRQMLDFHIHCVLSDLWIESWMSRPPREDIKETFKKAYEWEKSGDLKGYSKLEQIGQLIVGEHRYPPKSKTLEDIYDKEVLDIYQPIKPYLEEFESVKPFSRFVSAKDIERNMAKKAALYRKYIRPAFLKLLNQDVEKIKKEALEEEEMKKKIQEFLEKLIEKGIEKYGPKTEIDKEKEKIKGMGPALEPKEGGEEKLGKEGAEEAPSKKETEGGKEDKEGLDRRLEEFGELSKILDIESQNVWLQGKAKGWKVKPETVVSYENYKKETADIIRMLTDEFAIIFREDRRKKIKRFKKEGYQITPGLEAEHLGEIFSGNIEPKTLEEIERKINFAKVELIFLFDTTGSMAGEKIKNSLKAAVAINQAFVNAKEELEGDNLILEDEEPLKIAIYSFDVKLNEPEAELGPPLEHKKMAQIIENLQATGGGTFAAPSIKELYEKFNFDDPFTIKILVNFTDGLDDAEALKPVIQKIEKEDKILMAVFGLSDDEKAVNLVNTYKANILKKEKSNILAEHIKTSELNILAKKLSKFFYDKVLPYFDIVG